MARIVVTVSGVVALLTAAIVVVLLRDSRRSPRPPPGDRPLGERSAETVGRTAGMIAGALVAGICVLGFGGRLMMRLLAVTSGDDAQGLITEADATVGKVTAGGSIFLIVAIGGGAGLLALAVFVALRRWLPDRSCLAGLCVAGLGAGVLVRPTGFVDPDNPDFGLLSPAWLAMLLGLGLIVLFGLLLGPLVDRWVARWPPPSRSIRGVAGLVPLVALALVPVALVAVAVVLVASLWVQSRPARAAGPRPDAPIDAAGRIAVLVAAALGAASTLIAAGQILTA